MDQNTKIYRLWEKENHCKSVV